MNKLMERQLALGSKPFDGNTVTIDDECTITKLRQILVGVTSRLQNKFSNEELFCFFDWFEHDGLITPETPCDWHRLGDWIETEKKLYKSRTGDFAVYNAIYPNSLDFLLRYYVDDDEEIEDAMGRIDLSGNIELVEEIAHFLSKQNLDTTVKSSLDFFKERER